MQKILHADQRQKQNHKEENLPALHRESFPLKEGIELISNQGITLSAYEVSKKVIHLLRHSQQVQREEDGAVHFWRSKENLQSQFPQSIHWSDNRWKACLAGGGGNKRRFQYCTDASGTIVYFRALQGHSGRNLIDPSGQCDNSEQLLPEHLPCWMCFQFAFYHQFRINTWRSKVRALQFILHH